MLTSYLRTHKRLSTKALVGASLLTGISIILTRVFSVFIPLAGLPALRFGFGSIPIIISGIIFGPLAGALTGTVADLLGVMINPQGGFFPGFTLSAALRGAIPGLIFMGLKKKDLKLNFNYVNTAFILVIAGGLIKILLDHDILMIKNEQVYLYNQSPLVPMILFFIVLFLFIFVPFIVSKIERNKMIVPFYSIDRIIFSVTVPYIIISLGLNTLWLSMMFNKGFFIFLPGRIVAGLIIIPLHSILIYALSKFFKYMK